ncbi:permease prefix domain 1-containing protein [Mesobacillus foraminis]|uniref:permease prefix domain 1-containing protein n=1 Tax=Mesobacillus foraminis TaxID=279826 RepID=UPI000EF44F0F|nr:permease prefix domain 1-containing protein [Mesobacillus foraminis]
MKQIETFVESVYSNTSGSRKEIKELKSEMISHLTEAVHELKLEGKSEKEAIEIAIERFGGELEIQSIISGLFEVQRTFAKKILYVAIAFLLTGIVTFGLIYLNEVKKELLREDLVMSTILNRLGESKDIDKVKGYMQELVEKSPAIYDISLWDHEKIFSASSNEEFQKIKPEFLVRKDVFTTNSNVVVTTGYSLGNNIWNVNLTYISYRPLADNILLLGILIYWVLFTIWAIINVYHQRRLNIGWIIVFALFNIAGYFIYHLKGKRNIPKTIR